MSETIKPALDAQFAAIYAELERRYSDDFHAEPGIQGGGFQQRAWQSVYMMACLHLAAMLAIDTGMSDEVFGRCCRESWDQQNTLAPRFG